jgi:hypothetical protein
MSHIVILMSFQTIYSINYDGIKVCDDQSWLSGGWVGPCYVGGWSKFPSSLFGTSAYTHNTLYDEH